MKEPVSEFGRELRRLRHLPQNKYSQRDLAVLANVQTSYISELETGKRKPTIRTIRKLSPHLGVSANKLLKTIGLAEMDLAGTFAENRRRIHQDMPQLTEMQSEEIASYLTFLDFKSNVLG